MERKYPIVQFSEDKQAVCCCYILLVANGCDLAFYSPVTSGNWFLSNLNGDRISGNYPVAEDGFIDCLNVELPDFLAPGDCFRIVAGNYFSTPFQYIGCNIENTRAFEYWDKEDDQKQRIRLSCVIDNPQSKTEKSEYVDLNGINHSLSKSRRKEFEMATDFYPEYVHDAIKEILLYPNLSIDDTPMYESGDYDVLYNESDENNNARATTKLSEHYINRYSIC